MNPILKSIARVCILRVLLFEFLQTFIQQPDSETFGNYDYCCTVVGVIMILDIVAVTILAFTNVLKSL